MSIEVYCFAMPSLVQSVTVMHAELQRKGITLLRQYMQSPRGYAFHRQASSSHAMHMCQSAEN